MLLDLDKSHIETSKILIEVGRSCSFSRNSILNLPGHALNLTDHGLILADRKHDLLKDVCNTMAAQKERNMKDQDLLERIILRPKVIAGKPIIKGTRLTVEYILNLLAHGATTEEILDEYQELKREDIQACFLFATKSLGNTGFMPSTIETA